MDSIENITDRDVLAINRAFRDLRVFARVAGVRVCGGSFITYTLELRPGVSVKDVMQRAADIKHAVAGARGVRNLVVRVRDDMVIEVPHPYPAPLDYGKAVLRLAPGAMLAGRDYTDRVAVDSVISLDDTAHVLAAGTTGSGKSTLVRSLLGTLLLNTSPDDLVVYGIDLKAEDLLPFSDMPHVVTMAVDPVSALRVVDTVMGIVEQRRAAMGKWTGHRVLLVIDELAQLGDFDTLGNILSVGRSKRVHVLAATQKPTVKLIGEKANYTTRLVGRVADANEAAIATGRSKSGAEMLPGRGAFLRIEGSETARIQVYNFNDDATDAVVESARRRWATVPGSPGSPVITGDQAAFLVENWPKMRQNTGSPVITGDRSPIERAVEVLAENTVTFPIKGGREFTAQEAAAVKAMYLEGKSLTAICAKVYEGAKNKERMDRIKRATGAYGGAE